MLAIAIITVALASLVSFAGDVSSLRESRRGQYAADAVALAASRPGWSSTINDALEHAWHVRIDGVTGDSGITGGTNTVDVIGNRVDVMVRSAVGTYTASAVARTLEVTPDDPGTVP